MKRERLGRSATGTDSRILYREGERGEAGRRWKGEEDVHKGDTKDVGQTAHGRGELATRDREGTRINSGSLIGCV